MKNIIKDQKLIAIMGVIIIILAIAIIGIVLKTNKNKDSLMYTDNTPIHKEETHSMFVKINPFVKLVFKQEYDLCKDKTGREYICSDETNNVIDYELINDDAKNFYKDLDFKNKNLYDALLMLCETAVDNDIVFENLEITTDSGNIKVEQITDYLQEKSKYEITYTVNVNFEEQINEDKIIEEEKEENKTYLITFDTDGGSKVDSQKVTEGNKAIIPSIPTKAGYKFVEWQLNGESFDFNTVITMDITLKAIWEKENIPNEEETKPSENVDQETSETKPSESEKNDKEGIINLNDNVLYTLSGPPASEDYVSWKIKDVCFDKTIAQLKEIDPNYDQENLADSATWSKTYKDDSIITKKMFLSHDYALSLLYIFPNCKDIVPDSYKNILDNAMGWKVLSIDEDNSFEVKLITLDNRYKWETYHEEIDFSKYNLSEPNPYSGGGESPTPQLLTEEVCKEYHLKCDRW